MILVEVLHNPLGSSISTHSSTRRNHLYFCSISRIQFQCISCCAYISWGSKTNSRCAKKNTVDRSSTWPQTAQRVILSSKLIKIDSSHISASKIAGLELEAVCEERTVPIGPILKQKGNVGEKYPQVIPPPWGSLPDQDFENENHSNNNLSRISVETKDDSEDEIYYLEERDEEILSQRILRLSRSNKVRSALALYRSMKLSGMLPNSHSCNSLITCLLRNGRLNDAMKIFEFMKASEIVTSHTYSLILKAVANTLNSDAALRIFEEAGNDNKSKRCLDPIVYNTMIAIYAKSNNWVKAERMWRSLQDNGQTGTEVTYRMLICIFVRCGQNDLAIDSYHEMVQNGLNPTDDAMQAIIGACTREGKWDMALNVMQNMLHSDLKPSLITCNALINSLGKAAKVDLAFKGYSLVKQLGYEPDAYTWNALLGALNRANRHADALSLFERIREENCHVLNLHTFNTCLVSCQKLGLWERAVKLLWQMEELGFPISVTSYNLVIGACEAARKPKVALQIYQHMIQKKQFPDIFTPLSLIRVCIWGSFWDEVEEILSSAPNGSLYNAAIQGMCLRNKTDLARKLYMRMREIGLKPDGKTRALMLQNLPKS